MRSEKAVQSKRYKKPKPVRVNRSSAGNFGITLFLILLAIVMALPLVYTIGNAFKPLSELWLFPPPLLPQNPTFRNFTDLFVLLQNSWVPVSRYLFNTIMITTVGTVGQVFLASMCAYPLAKHTFPGKKWIFSLIVASLMFNASVTGIPNYLTMVRLGWIDTYWSIIIPAVGSSMGLYLMKQFMETSIPDALLEAAKIDGANEAQIFCRIVLPNVKPAWLTLTIFSVQGLWNMGSSIYIYSEDLKTFPYAISQILTGGIARAGVGSAVTVIMMLVPIGVFVLTQSNVVKTMSTSGMKD